MNEIYSKNSGFQSSGDRKRTNFILKESAAKVWPTYSITGTTELKPYPVFDANGVPCPSRMVSRFEADGNVPDAEQLTTEDIREYEMSVIPEAFMRVPAVTWVGRDGVQFIDFCSDLDQYTLDEERDADKGAPTPYTEMVRRLLKLIPTDKYKGDGKPCPPTLLRSRSLNNKGGISLRMASPTFLVRGALKRFKGQPLATKASVNGVLWRACLMISQASARNNLRNRFSEKRDPTQPISAENFILGGMFHPMGTTLLFSKVNPQEPKSDIKVDAGYDPEFNKSLCDYYSVADEAQYWAKIREELGAFQSIGDMLNIMTVKEQIDLIIEQFPASWVWYGLRDSRYADMIPEDVRAAALRDPEWKERFGVPNQVVSDSIPMTFPKVVAAAPAPSYAPPVVPRVDTPPPVAPKVPTPGAFTPPPIPANAQQVIQESTVSYQPKVTDPKVAEMLKKYGAQ